MRGGDAPSQVKSAGKDSVILVGMLARFAEAVRLYVLRGLAIHIACAIVLEQRVMPRIAARTKNMLICMHTQTETDR